jgi:hypothetical protein
MGEIKNGLATYGRLKSFIGAIVATIVGILLISSSSSSMSLNMFQPIKYDNETYGNVTSISCTMPQNICNIGVDYKVNSKMYNHFYNIKNKQNLTTNSGVIIEYSSIDPLNSQIKGTNANIDIGNSAIGNQFSRSFILSSSISSIIIVIILAWLMVYLTNKNKTFAAFQGASDLLSPGIGINF